MQRKQIDHIDQGGESIENTESHDDAIEIDHLVVIQQIHRQRSHAETHFPNKLRKDDPEQQVAVGLKHGDIQQEEGQRDDEVDILTEHSRAHSLGVF